MTSSLVGSEMCIRDSTNHVLANPFGYGHDLNVEALFMHWNTRATSSYAVSYTHLTLPTICSV
eukprot:552815-Prorocentrum_lima.AAC.1